MKIKEKKIDSKKQDDVTSKNSSDSMWNKMKNIFTPKKQEKIKVTEEIKFDDLKETKAMANAKKAGATCNVDFSTRSTKDYTFKTSVVRFSGLYNKIKFWQKCIIAFSLGALLAFLSLIFIKNTGLYSGGSTAFFQGIARLIFSITKNEALYNVLFWGLYLAFNIPILIFSWFKLGREFTILSGIALVTMQLLGLSFSFIPGISGLMIFGDTTTVFATLKTNGIQVLTFSVPSSLNNAGQIVTTDGLPYVGELDPGYLLQQQNVNRMFLLLIYAIVYPLLGGCCGALLYIIGGSTAGTDIFSIFFSQEKNKPIGKMLFIMNGTLMFMGVTIGSYFSCGVLGYWDWQLFFSANLLFSLMTIFISSTVVDMLFPWRKLVKVEINTNKIEEVKCHLLDIKYIHPTTIMDVEGGYSGMKRKVIMTICTCVELPKLIKAVRDVDMDCLISSSFINDLDGKMTIQKQTQ